MLERLRAKLVRAGTQRALAVELGVSLPYLNDVLRGRRDLGPAVLDGMGLVRVVEYREKLIEI